MLNIAGLTPIDDPSYRYKMPRMTAKIEGRGNGIKTVLTNVNEVSQSLNRDPAEVTKFFGCELGAQTTFASDKAVVNGSHNTSDLQQLLSKYIENFVLCRNCRLPETMYKIKSEVISQKCLACGAKESCDMSHKLCGFILSQYKKSKADKDKEDKDKKKKEEKRARKAEGAASAEDGAPTSPVAGASAESPVEKDKSEKKSKKDKKEKDDKAEKKAKKEKKAKEATASSATAAAGGDDASSDDEETDCKAAEFAIEKLVQWKNDAGAIASIEAILDRLRHVHSVSGLRPADRVLIFVGAYLDDKAHREKQIEKYKAILKALAPTPIHQRHVIAAIEWLCSSKYPSLLPYFPVLLKHLYDEDILEEDTILAWHADYSRNEFSSDTTLVSDSSLEQLKISAQPFCVWLNEAKEEGESSDDEDDDEEDEEEAEAVGGAALSSSASGDDSEDIDIDAI